MRRKECERDAAFAWEVLKNSIYSTVSMVCPDGTPYATPVKCTTRCTSTAPGPASGGSC